jgi:hypothetical protein
MAVTLKKFLGDGGAGLDDSMGFDNLYDVIKALADAQNNLVTQFNQLKADHDSSTTPTTAANLASAVTVE